jgi:hypothetical protein
MLQIILDVVVVIWLIWITNAIANINSALRQTATILDDELDTIKDTLEMKDDAPSNDDNEGVLI